MLKGKHIRAQTWHKPSEVAEALEKSLSDLQLNYGTICCCTSQEKRSDCFAAEVASGFISDALYFHPMGLGY